MWTYCQRTGQLSHGDLLVGTGYSGHGEGKNNPAMQHVPRVGPIPCGRWLIEGPPEDTEQHGPYVLRLVPEYGTETYGRSGFELHGDSIPHPGEASLGCIIQGHGPRVAVWESGDIHLEVIPEPLDAA